MRIEEDKIKQMVLLMRLALREHPVQLPLIHHSDRGVQYCSHEYVKILKRNKIVF